MIIILFRTVIIYVLMIFAMRMMGKRQIGELQPGELVITLIISNVAVTPIQDKSAPILSAVIPIITLMSLEIFKSYINLKSIKARTLTEGNAIVIIRDGTLDQKQMKELRLTIDDVLEALRKKDIFDINDVEYAILETDGNVTAMLKSYKKPLTSCDMNCATKDSVLPYTVISDGKIIEKNFGYCQMSRQKICQVLTDRRLELKNILLMTSDKNGKISIIKKEKNS